MRRRSILGILAALCCVMVLALACAGCSDSSTSTDTQNTQDTQEGQTTDTSATTDTPDPGDGKTIKMVFSDWMPPVADIAKEIDAWCAEFEEKTGGRYKIEPVHGGALASMQQAYDVVADGIAEFSHIIPLDTERPFPITEVPALPFRDAHSVDLAKAWNEGVIEPGYADAEYADVKLLYTFPGQTDALLTIKPVNSLADLKGMKLATGGGPARPDFIKALGAVPVFLPPTDIAPMLERGTIDGLYMAPGGLIAFGWGDHLNYLIAPFTMFATSHVIAMNKSVYEGLPDDVKAILDEMVADFANTARFAAAHYDEGVGNMQLWLDSGAEIIEWPAEEAAKLDALAAPIWTKWLEDKAKQGVPAQEALDGYYNALKAQGIEDPAVGYKPGQ